ncbi:HAD family hydrolase [Bacteroidota bacterium]
MKKIEHIIFDFGGVLYTIDFQRLINAFNQLAIPDSLWSDKKDNIFIQLERGEISGEEFIDLLQLSSPLNPGKSEVRDAFCAILVGMPVENLRFLRRIARNYPCYLLSNTNEIHFEYFSHEIKSDAQTKEFYNSFKKEYYSHELGLRKPDPLIYEYVIEDSGISPESCLFVDDLIDNVQAARKWGFQVFHFGVQGEWNELVERFQLKI